MSYCVNCGVELDESAVKCALCDTPVYNPNKQDQPPPEAKPFSDAPVRFTNIKRKFVASVISVVILIPNLICSLVNIFLQSGGYWSLYINASSILIWVMFIFPFLTKKLRPGLMWVFDTVASALYIYIFYALQSESITWYFRFALPITLAVSLCVLVFMLWIRRKQKHWTSILIHIFSDFAFIALVIGLLIAAFLKSSVGVVICMILFLSSLSLVGFFIYCNRSKHVRAWLSKKFFM